MSWNIAGAKAIVTDRFKVVTSCNYSIIVLQETCLVDPIELGGYSLHHIKAEKSNKLGRPSGGLATYISTALHATTEQLAFSTTDLQAIKINFSNSHHVPLIIFNVYAHPRKHRKALLFEQLHQKVEETRCVNPTWDILVTGDFNTNLIYTPEPDDQLAAENAIWSVLPQFPSAQTKLDTRGKQLPIPSKTKWRPGPDRLNEAEAGTPEAAALVGTPWRAWRWAWCRAPDVDEWERRSVSWRKGAGRAGALLRSRLKRRHNCGDQYRERRRHTQPLWSGALVRLAEGLEPGSGRVRECRTLLGEGAGRTGMPLRSRLNTREELC
ncbi:hypothetical protein NDU88_003033 [Pleurodeles waltl]|uniref:Endonuclease/exonuclease/phosphatase domain-containing protein n=1 Tax=Pleurodeles waltl TaxID=8319 RepID=A0AAV7SF10_PLEWA|nr:hypothetical protein NDU88_003033 [Pleurodeles waltl]